METLYTHHHHCHLHHHHRHHYHNNNHHHRRDHRDHHYHHHRHHHRTCRRLPTLNPSQWALISVVYSSQDDYLDACLVTCLQIHEDSKGDGDVLVFLPGQEDIEALSQLLKENLATLRADMSRYVDMCK